MTKWKQVTSDEWSAYAAGLRTTCSELSPYIMYGRSGKGIEWIIVYLDAIQAGKIYLIPVETAQ